MQPTNNLASRTTAMLAILITTLLSGAAAFAQTTAFTYQGKLTDGAAQANGTYDLGFALFDAPTGGNQIGATVTRPAVPVSNGTFTVQLDFGASAFAAGASRFLEIAVKRPADANFTTLAPRQPVTSTPYAIRALSAATADTATTATTAQNAQQLGGAAAGNFVQTDSSVFIRNQTAEQTADFNISGTGTALFLSAAQYNIGSRRVLSTPYLANLFVGPFAGHSNTTGSFNLIVGRDAGPFNTTGSHNAFVGTYAGYSNTTGGGNSFVGVNAGDNNSTGSNNTIIGANADVGSNNLTFATAIGAGAVVNASNTIVLGRTTDTVQIPGNLSISGGTLAARNVLARGGAPGAFGANNNGYAFGSVGDEDGGLFSLANGQVSLFTNSGARARVTDGGLQVFGALTATTKNFKIDHPLDPLNKTLTYTSVESPEMMNIYNGNITTNDKGEAIVQMPAYFEALNRDFRYQLTVIGTFA